MRTFFVMYFLLTITFTFVYIRWCVF